MKTFLEFLFILIAGILVGTGVPIFGIAFILMAIYMRVARLYELLREPPVEVIEDRRTPPRFGTLDPEHCHHGFAYMNEGKPYCPECNSWLEEGRLVREP